MTCRLCKYEFCWVCLGPWEPHGSSWYNCGRFNEADGKAARDAEAQSRAQLERYLFFFKRFENHRNSIKLEGQLLESVDARMTEIQQADGYTWIEVQFLPKGVEVLRRCRAVLQHTYVFSYYLKHNTQCDIFLQNQKDLENTVEELSGLLEGSLPVETTAMLRAQVLDKADYCDKRRQVMLDHVYEGYDKDWWEYPDDIAPAMALL